VDEAAPVMDSMAALTPGRGEEPDWRGSSVRPRQGGRPGHQLSDLLVENVHIEPLARQVQTGVQHGWSLLVLGVLTTQLCHRWGSLS